MEVAKMFLFLFLSAVSAFAGFSDLSNDEAYLYKKTERRVIRPAIKRPREDRFKELLENEKKLAILLKDIGKIKRPKSNQQKIIALTRTRGVLLNSVLAMNLRPTTFLIRLSKHKLLKGGELRCFGMSFQKRVPAKCDLLVLKGKEYEIDAQIWDLDGATGMIADYFYSGEEKAFLTSSLASFFSGVMNAAKDRIITPFGEVSRNNSKNASLSGIVGVADNARNLLNKSGEKEIEIAYVNSGREVLVFFNQSINL